MATSEKKLTKKEMFEQIKANYELNETEIEFINHELELLAKKNSGTKKPTANQLANESIKTDIVDYLGVVGEPKTITELIKGVESCNELSNQRVSAIVRQLVASKILVRQEIKRKAYFSVA